MSGINYYSRMKEIYDTMDKTGPNNDLVRKIDLVNQFSKDQGLKHHTAKKWFDMACDIKVIRYMGHDDKGNDLIQVV